MSDDELLLGEGGEYFHGQVSVFSQVSRFSGVDALTRSEVFSRQCSEIDGLASKAFHETFIQGAIKAAIMECRFCVTIGDPRLVDCPLIAVSDEFLMMTGYRREEIIGQNCRFLNRNCFLELDVLAELRHTCLTGAPFTRVVLNRKKSGELFLNLIDLRGLSVACNPETKEELWFVVGLQSDVSHINQDELEKDHLPSLRAVAESIRTKLKEELSSMAVSGKLLAQANGKEEVSSGKKMAGQPDLWWILSEPRFRLDGRSPGASDLELQTTMSQRQLSAISALSDDLKSNGTDHNTSVDKLASDLLDVIAIEDAIRSATRKCKFCVAIGDPRGEDTPLVAVSDEFLAMCGYLREEIVGKNCRLLSRNCFPGNTDMVALREACTTGAPFTRVILNRRKSGELFLNLLDLRGLSVAVNPKTGEDIWYLIGIQADVTHMGEQEMPENHLDCLHHVADTIRAGVADAISLMAIHGQIAGWSQTSRSKGSSGEFWYPMLESKWRPGVQLASRQSTERQTSRQLSTQISTEAVCPDSGQQAVHREPPCAESTSEEQAPSQTLQGQPLGVEPAPEEQASRQTAPVQRPGVECASKEQASSQTLQGQPPGVESASEEHAARRSEPPSSQSCQREAPPTFSISSSAWQHGAAISLSVVAVLALVMLRRRHCK